MGNEAKSGRRLSVREHDVLQTAVVLSLNVEYDVRNRATWDGDCLLRFRAHATLESLVKAGLMEPVMDGIYGRTFRATAKANEYLCRAAHCTRGRIYQSTDGAWDEEIGKCEVCAGTGLLRAITTSTGGDHA